MPQDRLGNAMTPYRGRLFLSVEAGDDFILELTRLGGIIGLSKTHREIAQFFGTQSGGRIIVTNETLCFGSFHGREISDLCNDLSRHHWLGN